MVATIWATQLRDLARNLSDNGRIEITAHSLFRALNAEDTATKARIRRSITHMVEHGEFERIQEGVFRFRPGAADAAKRYGESYQRMWRVIRTENAGWTMNAVAGTTRLHPSTVTEYCKWLEKAGYIARCGKKGNAILYRATGKAHEQRATPYPPVLPKDPYSKEWSAACRLIRQFMDANPAQNRETIINECRVILARFEQEGTSVE